MNGAGDLWKACSHSLRIQVSDATWVTWMAALQPETLDEETLTLSAPNSLIRDRLEERYRSVLEAAASDLAGRHLRVLLSVRSSLPVDEADDEEIDEAPPELLTQEKAPGVRALTGLRTNRRGEPPILNPRYTFDAFVIGSSNRFAHAAAQRVAETPANSYNPLFVHGDSGLGKTHLLHAIGHYVSENFGHLQVRYLSTETFMNDFVDAIRTNGQQAFKRRYRDCDVLLVDDIQFMEGKEGLQEEFFHTFNSLYEGNKQIVLSSDRHPRSIATLEDRLRSRFEWGLITDVQPPELETRLAILRKKADSEPTPIPGDVLELIATNVTDNIRELEGALIRVSAFASLNHEALTREKAEMILADILAAGRPQQITPKNILEATAATFGFSVDDLCGTSRRRPLVNARQIGMYVFRELTDFSYPAIAREFGGRDHTTVIHAVEKVAGLMKERRQTYDQVTELIFRIKGG
ncbi:MAG: chromosomal replication initiator protein DnaA [Acidimicrobiaceae bacterium]|nr:chromosomal replication initiator protein DnaA [Acidimicrobiaceae bacterium]